MTKIAAQIYSWDFDPQRKGIPGFVWSAFSLRNNCAVGATIGSGFCEKNFTFYRSCIIIYGNGDALLGKCGALRQYSEFIGLVRKARAEGKDEPLTWAVKEAIGRGLLPGYLERKSTEVINMLTMEYDYAVDVAAQKEESLAEGIRIGEERGLEQGRQETVRLIMDKLNLSLTQVMDALNVPPSERDSFAAKL